VEFGIDFSTVVAFKSVSKQSNITEIHKVFGGADDWHMSAPNLVEFDSPKSEI